MNKDYMKTIEDIEDLLPLECVEDCARSGDNYIDCEHWLKVLDINLNRDTCIEILRPFGAWSEEELIGEPLYELNIKVLWLASWNRKNNEEESIDE